MSTAEFDFPSFLGAKEVENLLSLLEDSRPFDEIVVDFRSRLPREVQFKMCLFLTKLLKAVYVKPVDNIEKAFINQLLRSTYVEDEKVLKQSAAGYIQGFDSSSHGEGQKVTRQKLLKKYCRNKNANPAEAQKFNSIFRYDVATNVIADPDVPRAFYRNSSWPNFSLPESKEILDTAVNDLVKKLSLGGLTPQWTRPIPPMLPILDGELVWLNTDNTHELLWDYGMCDDTVGNLIAKALKAPLSTDEELILKRVKNPKLVSYCGITVQVLPKLIEHNPNIAADFLIKLTSSSDIAEYLNVLVNMDVSLHSMEVVNMLITAVDLPTKFVHMYTTKCLPFCKDIKDKRMQSRLVKLVCFFLQTLVEKKKINVQDWSVEVRAFCMEFTRIREAARLSKLFETLIK